MIFVVALILAALTLAPLWVFAAQGGHLRGRQEAALALHRAQLRELDQELADGRLLAPEHRAAKLEVQRRLLSDASLPDAVSPGGHGRLILLLTTGLLPVCALGLYLTVGHPDFPPKGAGVSAPAQVDPAQAARDEALIAQLRARLAIMDPHNPQTLKGYELLGNAEASRRNFPAAAEAWQHVLKERFDPTLGVETAEVLTEQAGKVTPDALALFKRALAEAPADAPWRRMAEKRVAEAGDMP